MSKPEFLDPDLWLLASIHQHISALILKRVSDDLNSTKITRLAVLNRLLTIQYEIESIPLYLDKREELSQGRYDHLLKLLDGLVDQDVFHTGATASISDDKEHMSFKEEKEIETDTAPFTTYPKLWALVKRASEASNSEDLSTLLRFPQTDSGLERIEEVLAAFNDTNSNHSRADSQRDARKASPYKASRGGTEGQPEGRSELELDNIKRSQSCFLGLWNALKGNVIDSACNPSPVAKIQIRYPDSQMDDETQHKFFISRFYNLTPDGTGQPSSNEWQEITCKVVHQLPEISRASMRKAVPNICKVIERSFRDRKTLVILVHESCIIQDLKASRVAKSTRPILPLYVILREKHLTLGRYHKAFLALNLSHSLLRMYHSGMQAEWTSKDVFFLFDPVERKVMEVYNPYLAHSFTQTQERENTELENSIKFPLLIAFGKLLLEIALGRPIEDSELDSRADVALLTIMDEESFNLDQNVASFYCDAMETCFEANQCDDYDDDSDEDPEDFKEIDHEAQFREVLFTVIEHLEKQRVEMAERQKRQKSRRGSLPESRLNPNHPLELELQVSTYILDGILLERPNNNQTNRARGGPSKLLVSSAPLPIIQHPTSHSQLFDNRGLRLDASDPRCHSTKEFFKWSERFYTDHIESLPQTPRMRIAILDTGVDERNVFFRGIRRNRANKDSPFKEIRSFVPESTMDVFGHGTDVAALVLRIAPEADLYIAKISHGQEVAGPDQIVKAIEWAHSLKVDIINMSFGFSEDNDAIENAIGNAENDGIIIFAAASNYGGNAPRSFPARMDKVLCIHASDGNGNPSDFNPSSQPRHENFCTLGAAIESISQDGIYLFGTSYSTPVASGIAANVLRYVRYCTKLTDEQRKKASTRVGLKNIMLGMSVTRHEFQYVTPWRRMWNEDDTTEDVAAKIKQALKGDM